MATAETIAWVKSPEPIRGLDHLGVQVPCIALYGQLLPKRETPRVRVVLDVRSGSSVGRNVVLLDPNALKGERISAAALGRTFPWEQSAGRTAVAG